MMRELYLLNVSPHVLAALVWLGGTLTFGLVAAPVLRDVQPAARRAELFTALGLRLRRVGWVALGVLLLTGVLNLWFSGALTHPQALVRAWGRALELELAAVAALLLLSALHDFVLGPRAARLAALLGVLVLLASVRLARGG